MTLHYDPSTSPSPTRDPVKESGFGRAELVRENMTPVLPSRIERAGRTVPPAWGAPVEIRRSLPGGADVAVEVKHANQAGPSRLLHPGRAVTLGEGTIAEGQKMTSGLLKTLLIAGVLAGAAVWALRR